MKTVSHDLFVDPGLRELLFKLRENLSQQDKLKDLNDRLYDSVIKSNQLINDNYCTLSTLEFKEKQIRKDIDAWIDLEREDTDGK